MTFPIRKHAQATNGSGTEKTAKRGAGLDESHVLLGSQSQES